MKRKLLFFLTFALIAATPIFAQANWPKSIPTSDGGKLTMYEPQPESISGNRLTGRAAVSVRKSDNDEPSFGVVFFTATLQDDNEISSMRITQAKFSGVEDQNLVDDYSALLEKNSNGWPLGMTDKQLQDAVDREKSTTEEFKNAAPRIIYANKPSTLVVLEGEPKVAFDKNLDADKVVNSPNLIFKDGNQWNLYAGGKWYRSGSVTGNWKVNNNLSSKVAKVNEEVKKQEKENNKDQKTAEPKVTDIIVTSEPTELLQTDGEPQYKAVAGTSLLYVSNSPNEIFKDINTQKSYILIAGRWFSATNMNGAWTYVPSDQLPDDFAKIPEGSDKDRVLANVAGTDAAEDAIVNSAVPQTAKVDRRTATIDVQYDGEPVFNPIEGTSLDLAENSNVTVMIDAQGRYFALDNGVWFVGQSAYGPWKVANDRPRDVENIPASSPAYNSRYVYVYDNYDDYVYMGYTSGYLGSYYYGPTMVYGTGWHYRPWYRSVYYPRPITWGFGFTYDPWIGWNINWGWNYGFLYVGFNYGGYYGYPYAYGGGWFGPRYYCPPYRRHYYGGYYGRGYDYYGYNGYNGYNGYRDNYYGYNSRANGNGSRPVRRGNTPAPNNSSGWNRNYNLYNNQRGATTQNVTRTPRVYRPDAVTRVDNNNNRFSNRLNNSGRTREFENNFDSRVEPQRQTESNRIERGNNPRQQEVNRPSIDNNNNGRRPENTDQRRLERPAEAERPRLYNQPAERQQQQQEQRTYSPPAQRENRSYSPPAQRQERSYSPPAQREQRSYSPPAQREQRSYSPPAQQQRSYSPPARAERPSSSGSNSSGGGLQRGRPDRR